MSAPTGTTFLRLASSIKQGTVTASLMLRKLGSYPRQNGLAVALRELGRIERTTVHPRLAAKRRATSPRACRTEQGRGAQLPGQGGVLQPPRRNQGSELRAAALRASGLNLVTAAIVLWNTVYLERATQAMGEAGKSVDGELLQYLSPLGWEHINLTGDYVWRQSRRLEDGKFRPLRLPGKP